jgi:hypothetical protein
MLHWVYSEVREQAGWLVFQGGTIRGQHKERYTYCQRQYKLLHNVRAAELAGANHQSCLQWKLWLACAGHTAPVSGACWGCASVRLRSNLGIVTRLTSLKQETPEDLSAQQHALECADSSLKTA